MSTSVDLNGKGSGQVGAPAVDSIWDPLPWAIGYPFSVDEEPFPVPGSSRRQRRAMAASTKGSNGVGDCEIQVTGIDETS